MPDPIELYQLVSSVLRDVTQARFVADLYSRQISYQYEKDTVLRRFPVPRTDIEEAEINLFFSVISVAVDDERHTSRNAAISGFFDQFSAKIIRDMLDDLRTALKAGPQNGSPAESLGSFEQRVLASANIERLGGRLLQYFNENVESILTLVQQAQSENRWSTLESGVLKDSVFDQLDDDARAAKFYGFPEASWKQALETVRRGAAWRPDLDDMAVAVKNTLKKYADCSVTVAVDPSALTAAGNNVSSIKLKATVKNYRWSKVDVDKDDMRNIRSLNPE